jgi:Ca2+-binding EF-hand superfamily protein
MRHLPLALLFLSTSAAMAQPPGQPPTLEQLNQLFFAQYDADQDGQVTWDEFAADPAAKFRYLDRNADGVVDMQEVAAFTRMMHEQAPPPAAPQQ